MKCWRKLFFLECLLHIEKMIKRRVRKFSVSFDIHPVYSC